MTRHGRPRAAAGAAKRSQRGLSLMELMLAAALGVVMTAAIAQLFAGNSRAYVLLAGQARLQESARHAFHFLARSARSAGYFGCGTGGNLASGVGDAWRDDAADDISTPVAGVDGVASVGDAAHWDIGDRQLRPGSDVVVFRRIAGIGHDLAQPFAADGELVVDAGFRPDAGQLAVLAGCGWAGLLRVADVARPSGTVTLTEAVDVAALAPAGMIYGGVDGPAATVVATVASEVYFVARSRSANNRGEPVWALWRKTGRSDEIVSGVEDLQVLFGIDTTPDDPLDAPERYVPADGVGSNVVRSVHFVVTVTSVDAVTVDNGPIRRTFSQTVALRNPWTPI